MAYRDILVALTSYPDPTPVSAVEDAVSVAVALGAHLAALACQTRIQLPGHFVSASMVSGMIAGEAGKSHRNAVDLLAAFDAAADRAGILHETVLEKCITLEVPDLLVEYARLRDLTILPMPAGSDQWYAEAIIFGSGKPTLILPQCPTPRPFRLDTVAVAWDFSRAAARAIADAMPMLELAKQVRVVTVVNEKTLDSKHSAEEVARNLARHGVNVVLDQVDAKGRAIGEVLESWTASQGADLLVMGAYGHTRLREFVLGGATRSLLSKPPLPILFSH